MAVNNFNNQGKYGKTTLKPENPKTHEIKHLVRNRPKSCFKDCAKHAKMQIRTIMFSCMFDSANTGDDRQKNFAQKEKQKNFTQ